MYKAILAYSAFLVSLAWLHECVADLEQEAGVALAPSLHDLPEACELLVSP